MRTFRTHGWAPTDWPGSGVNLRMLIIVRAVYLAPLRAPSLVCVSPFFFFVFSTLFRGRGFAEAWPVLRGRRRPCHLRLTFGIQGNTWTFSRALWISPSFRANPVTPWPLLPDLEVRPEYGAGWCTRYGRAFRIPNGAIGSQSIDSGSFWRGCSAKLGIAAFPSVRAVPRGPAL